MRYLKARELVALATLLSALFCSSSASAQTCLFSASSCINIHIDGMAGEDGNGTPTWPPITGAGPTYLRHWAPHRR